MTHKSTKPYLLMTLPLSNIAMLGTKYQTFETLGRQTIVPYNLKNRVRRFKFQVVKTHVPHVSAWVCSLALLLLPAYC